MAVVTESILTKISGERIEFAEQITRLIADRTGDHFLAWFNRTLANKGAWSGVQLVDTPQNRIGFHQFWNNIRLMFGGPVSMVQFVTLMSILANEQRGNFTPMTERMGLPGHPGIAYLFNRIENKKRSYNTLAGNRTALDCFCDPVYIEAHGARMLGNQLRDTQDRRWAGEAYPLPEFPTRNESALCGFILEADFVKFRGRGFIQTTGRANYEPLIEYVRGYNGENSVIDFYQYEWEGKSADVVATETTNADWDRLFNESDLEVACRAIRLHNQRSGRYLTLAPTAAGLNAGLREKGSLLYMGKRISGGDAYAQKFADRVVEVLTAM